MKPFATGLVVGKFAPLHCGHEKLINTALAQCEELFIISYSVPEMPDCEPEKRLTWLQVRFPQATILVLTPISFLPSISLRREGISAWFARMLCPFSDST